MNKQNLKDLEPVYIFPEGLAVPSSEAVFRFSFSPAFLGNHKKEKSGAPIISCDSPDLKLRVFGTNPALGMGSAHAASLVPFAKKNKGDLSDNLRGRVGQDRGCGVFYKERKIPVLDAERRSRK